MAYADAQALIDRLGEDAVYRLVGRDAAGELDTSAIETAAADAQAEIDAYLAKRYSVPLDAGALPRVIQRVAIDITMYRLGDTGRVGGTDPRRQRYEDAISLLKRLASGEISLGTGSEDGDGEPDGGTPEIVGDQILDDESPRRLFGRRGRNGWPA